MSSLASPFGRLSDVDKIRRLGMRESRIGACVAHQHSRYQCLIGNAVAEGNSVSQAGVSSGGTISASR